MASNRIPSDIFYIMVAQNIGASASPTQAKKYIDSAIEIIYKELAQNSECYVPNLGNFKKSMSLKSAQHREFYNIATGRKETRWVLPKYVVGFNAMDKIVKALNEGEENYPKKKTRRKYKPKEYQEIRNERRRKEVVPLHKLVDDDLAKIRYEGEIDGKEE